MTLKGEKACVVDTAGEELSDGVSMCYIVCIDMHTYATPHAYTSTH